MAVQNMHQDLESKNFIKQISYNEMSKKGIAKIGQTGYVLSQEEKLFGHSRSIKIKMRKK